LQKTPGCGSHFNWKGENGQPVADLPFDCKNRFSAFTVFCIRYGIRPPNRSDDSDVWFAMLPSRWQFFSDIPPLRRVTAYQLSCVTVDIGVIQEYEGHILIILISNMYERLRFRTMADYVVSLRW
jgi:hypothetical protein